MSIFNPFDPYSFDSTFHHPHDLSYRSTFRGRPFHAYNPIPPPPWSPSYSWERPPWRRYQRESLRDYPSHDEYGFQRSHSDGVRESYAQSYNPYHDADAHWVPRTQRYRNPYHRRRPVRFPWSYYSARSGGEGGRAQRPVGSEGEGGEKEAYEVEEPDTDTDCSSRKGSNADGKKPEKLHDGHRYSLRPRVRCIVSPEEIPGSATFPTRPVSQPSPKHVRCGTPENRHSNRNSPRPSSTSSSTSSLPISEPGTPPIPSKHASSKGQPDNAERGLKNRRKALEEARKESDREGRRIEKEQRRLQEMELELREAEQRWREQSRRLEDEERGLGEEENGLGNC